MNCVETLARVNVLCVDKTGTITRPDMSVTHVEILDYTDGYGKHTDYHETERIIKNVIIEQAGDYVVFVRNKSGKTITVSGSYSF